MIDKTPFGATFSNEDYEAQRVARDQVDSTFSDYILDLGAAIPRGLVSAAQDVYGLADTITGDALPDWQRAQWQESSTAVGGLAEGIVNFATGFIPVVGALGKIGKISKLGRLGKVLQGTGGTVNRIARDTIAGGITDFLVWDGHEARFSDLVQQVPGLENPVTEWLASDEDDGEIEGRIKNVLEGGALGLFLDATVLGVKKYVFGKKAKDAALANGATKEEADQAAQEAAQDAVPDDEVLGSMPESVRAAFQPDVTPETRLDAEEMLEVYRGDPEGYQRFRDDLIESGDTESAEIMESIRLFEENNKLEVGFESYKDIEVPKTTKEFEEAYEKLASESVEFVKEVYPGRAAEVKPTKGKGSGGSNRARALAGKPIKRGAGTFKSIIDLAVSRRVSSLVKKGYGPDLLPSVEGTMHVIDQFIDRVGKTLFSDVNLTVTPGRGGSYDPKTGIVTVGVDDLVKDLVNGEGPWTFIHEMYHSVERFAKPKDLAPIRKAYQKQKAEFIRKNPQLATRLERNITFSYDELVELGYTAKEAKRLFREGYRFVNEAEYFAEVLTEGSVGKIKKILNANEGTSFERMVKNFQLALSEFFNATAALFGFRQTDKMVDDLLNGKWRDRAIQTKQGSLNNTIGNDFTEILRGKERPGTLHDPGINLRPGGPDFEESLNNTRSTQRPISKNTDFKRLLQDFRNVAAKYVDDPNENPRKLTVEELAESYLERNNLNLTTLPEDVRGVIRALEQFYNESFKASPHKKAKTVGQMADELADDIENLQQRAGEVDLATHLAALHKSGSDEDPASLIAKARGRIQALQTTVTMSVKALNIEGFTDVSLAGLSEREFLEKLVALDDLGYLTQIISDGKSELGRSLRSMMSDVSDTSVKKVMEREAKAAQKAADAATPIIDPASDLGAAAREARVLDLEGGLDDAQVKALIDRAGGRKVLMDRMKEIKMIYDVHGEAGLLNAAKVNRGQLAARFLETVWMSSMLSGPRTLLQNLSTIGAVGVRSAEMYLGALTTGDRQQMEFAKDFISHLWKEWGVAREWAVIAMKEQRPVVDSTGSKIADLGRSGKTFTAETVGAMVNKNIDPNSGAAAVINMAGNIIEYPFKALQGTDEFIGGIVYNSHITASAKQTARDEGLVGTAFDERVQSLVNLIRENDQATSMETIIRGEMTKLEAKGLSMEQAALQGYEVAMDKLKNDPNYAKALEASQAALGVKREVTFTDPMDGEGMADRAARVISNSRNEVRPLKFFLPFVKTPFNLLKFAGARSLALPVAAADAVIGGALRKSGLVSAEEAWSPLLRDLSSPDKAVQGAARGRVITGLSTMTAVSYLVHEGSITGAGPQDPEMRKVWEQAGNQAYSIKVGDGWMAYDRMDPLGLIVGGISDMALADNWTLEDEDPMEAAKVGLMVALSQNILNKSYFTGIANLVHTLEDPARRAEAFGETVGRAAVPLGSLGRSINNFDDPVMRETRGFIDAALQSVPVVGRYYKGPEVRNVLGETVKSVRSIGGESIPLMNAAIPWVYRSMDDDVLFNEFANLKHGFTPPKPQMKGIDLVDVQDSNGRTAYDYWMEQHGQVVLNGRNLRDALKAEIASPEYQQMSPESSLSFKSPRVDAISSIIKRYRSEALQATRRQFKELDQYFIEEDAAKAAARLGFDPALLGN